MAKRVCHKESAIRRRAATMPVGYLRAREAAAMVDAQLPGYWCYTAESEAEIRAAWPVRKWRVSEPELTQRTRSANGERVSGCCDRADQA
jgi:hypothetical protein